METNQFDLLNSIPISSWMQANILRKLTHWFLFLAFATFFLAFTTFFRQSFWAILGAAGETYSFDLPIHVSISVWVMGNILWKITQGFRCVASVTHFSMSTFHTLPRVAYKLAKVLNAFAADLAVTALRAATHCLLQDLSGMATKVP